MERSGVDLDGLDQRLRWSGSYVSGAKWRSNFLFRKEASDESEPCEKQITTRRAGNASFRNARNATKPLGMCI